MDDNRFIYIIFIVLIATIISFGIVSGVFAENYYVRAGATGVNDDSDWTAGNDEKKKF